MARNTNSFPATMVIIIIFAGAICLLSGICTGWVSWEAETGRHGSLVKNWHEAVIWGAMAFIPASLFFWSGLRQWRRGNNKTSGIILAILGLIGSGIFVWSIFSVSSDLRRALRLSHRVDYPIPISPYIYVLLILTVLAALSLWFVFVGFKILRHRPNQRISPETFD